MERHVACRRPGAPIGKGSWVLRFCMRLSSCPVLGLLAVGLASGASAASISVPFSGTIFGSDAEGATAVGSVTFDWDENCNGSVGSFCQLGITLTYDATSGPTQNQGSVLAGVLFEPLGSADFRDGPPGNDNWGGTVGAATMDGDDAGGQTFASINTVANPFFVNHAIDITGHWGVNPAVSVNLVGNFGSVLLSSVGSLFENLITPNQGLSSMQLLPGIQYPNLEGSPPNGSSFGVITSNFAVNQFASGFGADTRVFAVESIRASINYTGTLNGVTFVEPVFGTKGLPIPEPGTAALAGFGLLGLLAAGRRIVR